MRDTSVDAFHPPLLLSSAMWVSCTGFFFVAISALFWLGSIGSEREFEYFAATLPARDLEEDDASIEAVEVDFDSAALVLMHAVATEADREPG